MSEPRKPWAGTPFEDEYQMLCEGIDRERARADRSEAEFSACKALLIAAQQRAERAEAERAEARTVLTELLRLYDWRFELAEREKKRGDDFVFDVETARLLRQYGAEKKAAWEAARRALAALPVEPARRQVTETATALWAPAARSPATPEEER